VSTVTLNTSRPDDFKCCQVLIVVERIAECSKPGLRSFLQIPFHISRCHMNSDAGQLLFQCAEMPIDYHLKIDRRKIGFKQQLYGCKI